MPDIRRVTETFAVAPQLAPEDMAEVARLGYRLIVNNRPDDEAAGQPTSDDVHTAAEAAGLGYVHIPVDAASGPNEVAAVREAVEAAEGPVLAFCRSGTRSITYWARGQAQSGARSRDELVRLGREAGYDLSGSI
jgi:uncharacterized protein (TIGR01244 family)